MSKHFAPESIGTKAMEQLEQTLCRVYGRRSAIQGQGRHRADETVASIQDARRKAARAIAARRWAA